MKITAYYPALLTHNAEKEVERHKKYGFNVVHERNNAIEIGDKEYILENTYGHRMDIVYVPGISKEEYAVRINVDDFDEAVKVFTADGFVLVKGTNIVPDSKNALFRSSDGLLIMLMQHL